MSMLKTVVLPDVFFGIHDAVFFFFQDSLINRK